MEEKTTIGKKKIIIIASILGVIMIAVIGVLFLFGEEEGYRTIQIYELDGKATLKREGVGEMDAYVNLMLKSEDVLVVDDNSTVRLKMDEDKYMHMEPNSEIQIHATGNSKDSKTDIMLKKGAVTVQVKDKLSEKSSYRITTPNSVMAIRGTVFRVEVSVDEFGKYVTHVTIFEGKVAVQKINEDGSKSRETLVEEGKEAYIYNEDQQVHLEIHEDIDLEKLPTSTLQFIKAVIQDNTVLAVKEMEIDKILNERLGGNENTNQEVNVSETPQEDDQERENDVSQQVSGEAQSVVPEIPHEEGVGMGESISQTNVIHKVTFMYNGNTFGTQQVRHGEKASKPRLVPAKYGAWNFDFDTLIEEDTIIEFVQ